MLADVAHWDGVAVTRADITQQERKSGSNDEGKVELFIYPVRAKASLRNSIQIEPKGGPERDALLAGRLPKKNEKTDSSSVSHMRRALAVSGVCAETAVASSMNFCSMLISQQRKKGGR